MEKSIKRVKVCDLEQGLMESSATPVGTYRTFWIMKLRQEKGPNSDNKCTTHG